MKTISEYWGDDNKYARIVDDEGTIKVILSQDDQEVRVIRFSDRPNLAIEYAELECMKWVEE